MSLHIKTLLPLAPTRQHRLSVLTFNVLAQSLVTTPGTRPYLLDMGLSAWAERWPRLCSYIEKLLGQIDADVIVLCECDFEHLDAWALFMNAHDKTLVEFATRTDNASHGVALFVSRRSIKFEHVETARTGAATIIAALQHVTSEKRFVCVGTHLKAKAANEEQREREVVELTRLVHERFGTRRPMIVAGDMNTHDIARSPSFTALAALARRDRHCAASLMPFTTIKEADERDVLVRGTEDHVLFTDDDFVLRRLLVPTVDDDDGFMALETPMPGRLGVSDHVPVLVELDIE